MNFEYQTLIFMGLFFLLAWCPASLGKWKSYGRRWILSNRKPVTDKELLPWAGRAERAHHNLKDNFPGFATAILLLGLLGKFDQGTAIASGVYLFCRLGHFASYIYGNVPIRGLTYFTALSANIYLFAKVLY